MKNKLICILLLISFCSVTIFGQEDIAVPYQPDEFPQWTVDLRRAEIVTVGSFPLTFMLTALVYDLSVAASNGFGSSVPFGSSRTQDDIETMLLVSAGISAGIGLTDFIISQIKRAKARKEQEKLDEQRRNNSESAGLTEDES